MSKSSAKFTGVFSLKTNAEVEQLVSAVKFIVEKGVDVFFIADKPDLVTQLLFHLGILVRTSSSFIDLTLDEGERNQATQLVNKMSSSEKILSSLLKAHVPGTRMNEDSCKKVADNMKSMLMYTADLTDMMEENQAKRAARTTKQAFEAVSLMKEAPSDSSSNLENKLKYCEDAMRNFQVMLQNRINVTEAEGLKRKFEQDLNTVKSVGCELVPLTRQVASSPNDAALRNKQQEVIRQVALVLKDVYNIVESNEAKIRAMSDFGYARVNNALDDLHAAVKAGSARAATDQAKIIVEEINTLQNQSQQGDGLTAAEREAQENLKNTCAALRNMTAKLVSVTKQALQEPNNKQNLDSVANMVAETKNAVSTLGGGGGGGGRGQKANTGIRATLIQASNNIGK